MQRNVLAMSGRAVEAAGDVHDAAARQDRHDHVRLAPGRRVHPGHRRRRAASSPRVRWRRRSPTRRRRAARSSSSPIERLRLRADRRPERRRSCRSPPRPACRAWTSPTAAACARAPPTRSRRFVEAEGGTVPLELLPDRRAGVARRGHAARRRSTRPSRGDRVAGARRDPAQGHRQAGHARALRPAPRDGHPHGHDHRRQPADRGGDRRRGRASTTSSPRRRPRTRWR